MGRRKKAPKASHIVVVQDKSGSMLDRLSETITGYNQFINKLREDAEGDVYVTLVQFDTDKVAVYVKTPLDEVPELNSETYVIGGMTALNDGVAEAINRVEKFARADDNVTVTIMTDGGENSSREYGSEAIKTLIKKKTDEGWEFNYLGAGPAAWAGAASLGISSDYAIMYGASGHDHAIAFGAVAGSNIASTRGLSSSYASSTPQIKSQLENNTGAVPDNVLWSPKDIDTSVPLWSPKDGDKKSE